MRRFEGRHDVGVDLLIHGLVNVIERLFGWNGVTGVRRSAGD
jgi:hypothetical protein